MSPDSYKKVAKMNWLRKIDAFSMIVCLYAISTLLLSTIPFKSWETLALGLFLAASGSLATLLILKQRQTPIQRQPVLNPAPNIVLSQPPVSPSLEKNLQEAEETLAHFQQRHDELMDEIGAKKNTIQLLEKDKNAQSLRAEEIFREFSGYKQNTEEELRRKQVLLEEYQETINQQRDVITKKQEQIAELEAKVHDLNYEVKTLLQLAELANKQNLVSDSPEIAPEERPRGTNTYRMIGTTEEASEHLKRCLDIAQKITSANRFGTSINSRFKDLPIDNRALDLRRLFDNLRCENAAAIFVFSQKENMPVFANAQLTEILGWPTEKFIQQFPEIISESIQEWKKGLSALATSPEAKARLLLKTRAGKNLLLHCHLGIIATGAFRNHIIGVLYSA